MVDITLIGAASGFVLIAGVLYYVLWFRDIGQEKYEEFRRRQTSELVAGIFGSEVAVDVVNDFREYGRRIADAAENSTKVYRISGNAATFPMFDEEETFSNPGIENRILILSPEYSNEIDGFKRESSGLDALIRSRHVDSHHTKESSYEQALLQLHRRITNEDWDVDVRLYRTTPWLRGVIFDDQAGVMMSPNLYDFQEVAKFWVSDGHSCTVFRDIFDDIWNDPDTITLDEWADKIT